MNEIYTNKKIGCIKIPFAKMCGILKQNDLRSILHMIRVRHDQNEFI